MIKNKIGILLLALTVFVFTSCEDETVKPFEEASLDGAYLELGAPSPNFFNKGDYANTATSFDVNAIGENGVSVSSVDVIMYYKEGVGQANQGPFNVGTVSSLPGNFSISLADLTENTLGLTEADIMTGAEFTFFFEMQTSVGTLVQGGPAGPRSVNIPVSCPSDLSGWYSTETTYSQHDFLPDYSTGSIDSVFITEEAPGVYSVTDASGGLYSEGPYVAAYGTSGIAMQFKEVCSNLTWSDQMDDWGPFVPTPGEANSVDINTGVITMSWLCEGFAESGVTIYTPLD